MVATVLTGEAAVRRDTGHTMSRSEHDSGDRDHAAHEGMDMPHGTAFPATVAGYQAAFREAPYYSTGREWSDYAPAYALGLTACGREPGMRFDAIEQLLEAEWVRTHAPSRLSWAEARGPCEHAWRDCRNGEGAQVHEAAATIPGRHGA